MTASEACCSEVREARLAGDSTGNTWRLHAAHSDSIIADICRPRLIVTRESISEEHLLGDLQEVDLRDLTANDAELTRMLVARRWIEPEGETVQTGSGPFEGFRLPMISNDLMEEAEISAAIESDRGCENWKEISEEDSDGDSFNQEPSTKRD